MALLAASLLTLIAICLAFMGFWRVFRDLDLAGEFVFTSGILSHWQVWLAAAAGIQYGAWNLRGYYHGTAIDELVAEIQNEELEGVATSHESTMDEEAELPTSIRAGFHQ